jgi:hypothetical protein
MDTKEEKYNCEQCKFKCNTKARWNAHINTELHKTGTKKKRSDYKEPTQCEKCEYKTKNRTTLIKHTLNKHATKEEREKQFRYYCKICDFGTFSEDSLLVHENTEKHKHFNLQLMNNK